eukprot:5841256-Alexandrium_andersonii.AAC.1
MAGTRSRPTDQVAISMTGNTEGRHIAESDESDAGTDYWVRGGTKWTRVHVVPRAALYVPDDCPDGNVY